MKTPTSKKIHIEKSKSLCCTLGHREELHYIPKELKERACATGGEMRLRKALSSTYFLHGEKRGEFI